MFDIGWSEMAVIALIALIVIGPKELPNAMRLAAKWVRKARGLAREFQSGIDDMIREADLQEAREAVDSAKNLDLDKAFDATVDPTGSVREEAEDLQRTAREDSAGSEAAGEAEKSEAEKSEAETSEAEKSGAEKSGAEKSGAEKSGAAGSGAEASEAGATVVEQPVNVAPAHSVTPPPEPAAAEGSEAAAPDDGSQKSA
jgi:sec-independent protein translocase protein TatB